ncbi:MAG: hypothetical protein KBS81_01620, partial [Spirochaetales bacterium]|nr:hypothetical protein [Candidatus Physcosoma equi]
GKTFKGTDYNSIRPVVSIWVVMEPEKSRRGTWIRTGLEENPVNEGNRQELDVKRQLNAILEINLGKSENGVYTDNVADKMLRILFEEELSAEETRERLCAIGLPEVAEVFKEETNMGWWGLDEYYREKAEEKYINELRERDRAEVTAKVRAEVTAEVRAEVTAEVRAEDKLKHKLYLLWKSMDIFAR